MKRLLAAAMLLTVLAGCTQAEEAEATLTIDFNGHSQGVPSLTSAVIFDPAARPSQDAYAGRSVAHPDVYTVHDLLVDWNGAHGVDLDFFDGLGYAVDGLFGVHSDFQDTCWFWQLAINGEPSMTGISTTAVAAGDQITFTYTDCWSERASSTLEVDFDGLRPGVDVVLTYDGASRPSSDAYEGRDVAHPDHFTVHDLMTRWSRYSEVNMTYYDGLGYAVQGIFGLESEFSDDACRYWALAIDGVDSMEGMSTAMVPDGATVTWTYTDCA